MPPVAAAVAEDGGVTNFNRFTAALLTWLPITIIIIPRSLVQLFSITDCGKAATEARMPPSLLVSEASTTTASAATPNFSSIAWQSQDDFIVVIVQPIYFGNWQICISNLAIRVLNCETGKSHEDEAIEMCALQQLTGCCGSPTPDIWSNKALIGSS